MGTLTKAFTMLGGYVTVADASLVPFLKFGSPGHIFSAPIPPWMASVLVQLIQIVKGPEGDRRRDSLAAVSAFTRSTLEAKEFNILGARNHLIPVHVGTSDYGQELLAFCEDQGVAVSFFEVPVVPRGSEMIRISMRADTSFEGAERLVQILCRARDRFRF